MPNVEFAKFCIQNVLITQSDRFLGELEVVSIVEIIGPVACNSPLFLIHHRSTFTLVLKKTRKFTHLILHESLNS